MIQQLSINDASGLAVTLHRTTTRRLTSASGLMGVGPLRSVVRPRPTNHGGIDDTRWQEAQPITLEGAILGTSNAAVTTEFRQIAAAALQTLDGTASLLKWTDENGLALQRYIKLAGALDPALTPQPKALFYQLQLLSSDPRAYSQTLGSASASGTANVSVINGGNRTTPPTYRVWGSAVNPQVVSNSTGGTLLSMNGTFAASTYLEVDVFNRTAILSTAPTVSAMSRINSGTTSWQDLAAGTTTLHLAHAGGTIAAGSKLEVFYRDAWV